MNKNIKKKLPINFMIQLVAQLPEISDVSSNITYNHITESYNNILRNNMTTYRNFLVLIIYSVNSSMD